MRVVRLTVQFSSGVFHGSGTGVAGIVDRAFLRDGRGIPYLAGSALKGKFRFAALRMLRSLEEPVCQSEEEPYCREEKCDLCRVFGSPRGAGTASFFDAYPYLGEGTAEASFYRDWIEASPSILLSGPMGVRATTAINRRTQTTERNHLFTTEVAEGEIAFHGTVRIRGARGEGDLAILRQAARLVDSFGGGSGRGLGQCVCSFSEIAGAEGA